MAEHICYISAYHYVLYASVFCHIQTSELAYMLILRVVRQTVVMLSVVVPLEVPRYFMVLILAQVANFRSNTCLLLKSVSLKDAKFLNNR
jgi:hypothetical protein